jgi:cation diffusion facilitator family transporter
MAGESKRTVVVAFTMNLLIAIAKTIVGVLGGSSAMLSEAAHSFADTMNEVFLLTSLRRGERPADATHPFGYGMERFFWSLLAAVGIFVSGAVFSIYQGVTGLMHPEIDSGHVALEFAVLAVAFVAEGASWVVSVRQLRGEARTRRRGFFEHIRRSHDPTVKTVFSEDSAALIGLIFAAVGIAVREQTGNPRWDSVAALAIGVLLAFVAYQLGRDTKELLIGEAADSELRQEIWRELAAAPEVDAIVEILTMQLGPEEVLVAARLDLAEGLDSTAVEEVSARLDHELHARHPEITQVFLDATRASARQRARSRRLAAE